MLNHGLPILRIFFLLFISIQNSYGQQNCPANMIQLYNGVSCQTDQACQRLSPGFFCYNGFCCANSISVPSGYGSACTYDNQCAFANSQCVGNICYCRADFNYNGQNCQPTRGQLPSKFRDPYYVIEAFNALGNAPCSNKEISIGNMCYKLQEYYDDCDFSQQCNYIGAVCNLHKCTCGLTDIYNGFQCVRDQMLPTSVTCPPNQIQINNQCYSMANINEPCIFDQQCRPSRLDSGGTACIGGYCQPTGPRARDPKAATCRNPSAHAEVYGSTPKNCISQSCSPGYHCEYNSAILQYICCGGSNGQYGEIKMYPGYSNLPLQCTGINSCTFVDFPYCVFSQSYNHNVCCSKQECL
ncbi:EB domain and Cysteine-rich repeat-containing protein [Aphelenchoides besseyi]|nr:EB domain and Cysteine-rich repeat-containing protein [Aphelenchoides besseyi]KAI6237007.1 EB domain and Cysteine-rich repeat-containing protein [Aphelenchoides besseyi]